MATIRRGIGVWGGENRTWRKNPTLKFRPSFVICRKKGEKGLIKGQVRCKKTSTGTIDGGAAKS